MDNEGYCHSCDEEETVKLADKDSCERVCDGKNGTSKRVADFWGCKLAECPANKPLADSFAECRTCKYDAPVSDTEHCSLCPNRKVQNGWCVIADCSDRPLIDANGVCYPCSTGLQVSTLSGECASVCPNRRESGSWSSKTNGVKSSGVFCVLGGNGDE